MTHSPIIERHTFQRRPPALPDGLEQLSPESQAALRQFSSERLVAYGLAREDAVRDPRVKAAFRDRLVSMAKAA